MNSEELEKILTGVDNLAQTNDFYKIPPEPVLPPVHPLVQLKQAVVENISTQTRLDLKRIFLKMGEVHKQNNWTDLDDQKTSLRELFIASNNGIKENKASMMRFHEIINEERKTLDMIEKQMITTQTKIDDYKNVQDDLKQYVGIYSVYEDFLENVAQVGENWRSVGDILTRYETLQHTNMECTRMLGYELKQFTDLRKQIVAIVEDKSTKLKGLNNRLVLLQVHSKEARDKREHWEHMVGRIRNAVLDRTQDALTLNGGIYDLYRNMCKRLKIVAGLPEDDAESQLDFIHKTILFYKEVVIIASSSKPVPLVKKMVVNRKRFVKRRT